MMGTVALIGGLALVVAGLALFYVEHRQPGKLAEWFRDLLGR